jgi:hypothetical protein
MYLKNYYKLKITFFSSAFIAPMFVVTLSNYLYTMDKRLPMEVFGEIIYEVTKRDYI